MKNFSFEDGVFCCNKDNKRGYGYHEVEMKIQGDIHMVYEIDENTLRKPKGTVRKVDKVTLKCADCSNCEDVTQFIDVEINNNHINWNFK